MAVKPKVLALHGFCQSADIFCMSTFTLQQYLDGHVFETLQGAYRCRDQDFDKIAENEAGSGPPD